MLQKVKLVLNFRAQRRNVESPGRVTPYDGLYGEVPPEMVFFFRLEVYKGVGFSRVKV